MQRIEVHSRVRISFFFLRENKLEFTFQFVHEMLLKFILAGDLKGSFLRCLPKMLPGETLCKMVQIFPPKVLVYTRKIFLDAIFYIVRENSKQIK